MRGDSDDPGSSDAIDTYIDTSYRDSEPEYRDRIFELGL
jgi:hypothetical protein